MANNSTSNNNSNDNNNNNNYINKWGKNLNAKLAVNKVSISKR